ncbi:MAG: D-2-hydroxyacid dehydrogenase [Clostridia bacterium]|nr:D-2-hydroxyacid dehydrogenase [Clostridia bacterium]
MSNNQIERIYFCPLAKKPVVLNVTHLTNQTILNEMTLKIFIDFSVAPDILELLKEGTSGHQLIFSKTPATSVLVKAKWDPQLETVDIFFGQPDPKTVGKAGQLKWIHISTSSITRYDNPEFRDLVSKRNIAVSNSASVYNEACAVHTMSFILAQARQLPLGLNTHSGIGSETWYNLRNACVSLQDQTVLILGYGAIGKRLSELLRPFNMKVIAYRRKVRGDEGVQVITGNKLDHALSQEADHIVNILPESAETQHFFDANRFAAIKPGAVFYNIGRGTTVNQDALLDALRSGRLKAAWLDVTDPEPLPGNHPLLTEPNCFITPHVAGGHLDEAKTLVHHFLRNFKRFVRAEPLNDQVM